MQIKTNTALLTPEEMAAKLVNRPLPSMVKQGMAPEQIKFGFKVLCVLSSEAANG